MNVLLMLPYDPMSPWDVPDLGLGYLASSLKHAGHTVKISIRDRALCNSSKSSDFIQEGNYNIIGIKVLSSSILHIKKTIQMIREVDKDVIIVIGGPHVSGDPFNVFTYFPSVNYAIHAEGEIAFIELLKTLPVSNSSDNAVEKIPNLIWRKGTSTLINDQKLVDDLDTLPFPSWELMNPQKFPFISWVGYSRGFPIAPVIATRGCPRKCTFCGSMKGHGYKLRTRSAANVFEELKYLKKDFGVKEIQFWDDNCAHPNGPLRELMEYMIKDKLNLTWNAPNGIRVDSIEKGLPSLMKKSGCFRVSVGIESGSTRILKQIKKGITLDMVREKVSLLRGAGIEVTGFFIIGFPGESLEEISQTIRFSMELPLTEVGLNIFYPLPGTDIHHDIFGDEIMDDETLGKLNHISYENNLSEVSFADLRKIQKKAYLKFYLRYLPFVYIVRNLSSMRKIKHIAHRFTKLIFSK